MASFVERACERAFGIDARSLAALRIGLAAFVLCELVDRSPILAAFYSDEGILPTGQLDPVARAISAHAWSGGAIAVRALALLHGVAAALMLVGWRTRAATLATWYLYVSLTLRNCGVAYIADRYAHFFLLLAAFLPTAHAWSVDAALARRAGGEFRASTACSAATLLLRLQLVWIYADAGYGKAADPEGAWLLSASPPALDSMLLHTRAGRALRAALRPMGGVRLLSASVVWAECGLPCAALLCAALGWPRAQAACAALMAAMHIGIGLCMNNAALLSMVAVVAWAAFIPGQAWDALLPPTSKAGKLRQTPARAAPRPALPPGALLLALAGAVVAFNARQSECDVRDLTSAAAGASRAASALLHNRWNVFTSGESHVTWYLAPARLADGSVVDLWSRGGEVSWEVPAVAPRAGRWKSFAAVAFAAPSAAAGGPLAWLRHAAAEGEPAAAAPPVAQGATPLWRYLCAEWNRGAPYGRRALRFNFFLLSADLLLEGESERERGGGDGSGVAFGPPRKRLLAAYECD